ncbi:MULTISPECIES: hypothetical protein [unclassified Nostoc]|uniref:hypothetical protein n=1 Tax=unclassified Nostoc TaxID=2593658 RepID=UPI001F555D3C|nr:MULTISPECIES: hypothetical protein [unclassified Nostoc]
MQPKDWKNFFSVTFLTLSGASNFCIGENAAWGIKLHDFNEQIRQPHYLVTAENIPSKLLQIKALTAQSNPASPTTPDNQPLPQPQDTNRDTDLPQIEGQPKVFPESSPIPVIIEELFNEPSTDRSQRLERLRQLLQQRRSNPSNNKRQELNLQVRPRPLPQTQPRTEANDLQELELLIKPRPWPRQPTPPIQQPVAKFKPIGSLQAQVGYFYSSNIFSSEFFPTEDGLMFYGLRLASAYFPLTSKTYINGSIDGNLIRYTEQSKFNYNQLSFNIGLYQQFSSRMYGELAWSNQQFFYARNSNSFAAGDRFLNENSLRLSLGRRDPLNSKLSLDSFYQFSANFSEPDNRSRIINSVWVSLNYKVQQPLQVGINYQFNLSDFTQRQRDDEYHRIFGHIFYRVSDASSLNLQSGISFGDSTDKNIDFDGWFLTVYYNLKLGEF